MKLKLFLILLIALIFVSRVGAIDGVIDDAPSLNNTSDINASNTAVFNTQQSSDTENTLSWPAIPGESLNDIARAFYPKNSVMRRLFVTRTLRLNTEIEPTLKPSTIFEEPVLLTIPTLKSLSKTRQAINAANRAKTNRQELSMSYSMNKTVSINSSVSKLPTLLLQEYELLLSKNAFLKAELERLQIRLGVLQEKLNHLKLALDKTFNLPASAAPEQHSPETVQTTQQTLPAKKVFKNLAPATAPTKTVNQTRIKPQAAQTQSASKISAPAQANQSLFNSLKYWLLALLGFAGLVVLAAILLKKYRQRMLNRLSDAVPEMDDTMTDFGKNWQDTDPVTEPEYVVEHQPNSASIGFLNTDMRDDQAKAITTLEEAKLLMSINRTQDAVAHLKLTIETDPKASINHSLYLLEIFRKLNLKEEFEAYAKRLHITFNVMTPVWYEANAAIASAKIVVPQYLEEFPHIMDKLDAVWPSELAKVYLQSLITDNRDGDRAGFSAAVLAEILMLITLLDTRKDLEKTNS